MTRLLPLLLLLACAAPESAGKPSAYNQGAARPPPPPRFNPATDAPHTVGAPSGFVRPELPRSPHTRVLPPTREPGVWAGDGPKAAHPGSDLPNLFSVTLPLPDDADDGEVSVAVNCSHNMVRILAAAMRATVGSAIQWGVTRPPTERACVAAKLYRACTELMADHYKSERAKGNILAPENERQINRVNDVAGAFATAACPKGTLSEDAQNRVDDAIRYLRAGADAARHGGGE